MLTYCLAALLINFSIRGLSLYSSMKFRKSSVAISGSPERFIRWKYHIMNSSFSCSHMPFSSTGTHLSVPETPSSGIYSNHFFLTDNIFPLSSSSWCLLCISHQFFSLTMLPLASPCLQLCWFSSISNGAPTWKAARYMSYPPPCYLLRYHASSCARSLSISNGAPT